MIANTTKSSLFMLHLLSKIKRPDFPHLDDTRCVNQTKR
nr:MAG TPA: hypothetical protein [Caudoviricetes sp.]